MNIKTIPTIFWIALATGGFIVLMQFLKDIYYFGYINLDMYASLMAVSILSIAYMGWVYFKKHQQKKKDIRTILTQRELEVYQKLLENKTNSQIANELFIEESTLKTHINKIYKKLDVRNRREVIDKASTLYAPA